MGVMDFLTSAGELAAEEGPEDHVVLSSRVRLARNLSGVTFPGRAKKASRVETCKLILPVVSAASAMRGGYSTAMSDLKALDKQLLVERHLISREHAAKSAGSALVLNKDETLSVMVNEEDHLRMQALLPGMQIKQVWQKIDRFDTSLEKKLEYAFDTNLGYLTACPTNLGTGIRVSAMLHLPGLVLTDQVNQIVQAVTKLGHAVRGLYGEGTEALGHIFQVSNQMTLGESEADQATQQQYERTREKLKAMLVAGELEERTVELTIEQQAMPVMLSGMGMEQMDVDLQGMFEKIIPSKTSRRKLTVADAREVFDVDPESAAA